MKIYDFYDHLKIPYQTTIRFFLPFCLRLLSIARPSDVDIRLRNPHLRARFNLDGLYVLFMIIKSLHFQERSTLS